MAADTANRDNFFAHVLNYIDVNTCLYAAVVLIPITLMLLFFLQIGPKRVPKGLDDLEWEGGNVCIVRRQQTKNGDGPLGVVWENHSVVKGVIDGSPAALSGMRSFIGRQVSHINGEKVKFLSDIRRCVAEDHRADVVLQFKPEEYPPPVLLSVGVGRDQFSEADFKEELARLTGYNPRLITIGEVSEESAFLITVSVTFADASPAFVRQLMDACKDSCNKLVSGLSIVGVSIGAHKSPKSLAHLDGHENMADLFIYAQWCGDDIAPVSGAYVRRSTLTINGQPVWGQKRPADAVQHWLYSSPNGYWYVTQSTNDFVEGSGIICTEDPHGGQPPDRSGNHWIDVMTGEAQEILISKTQLKVQGLEVGDRIMSSEDITERTRIIVPMGRLGWVKMPSNDSTRILPAGGVPLRVKFENVESDVLVQRGEVDRADGPVIDVFYDFPYPQTGKWLRCRVVNERDDLGATYIKVHYIGYGHQEWIHSDSDRIRPEIPIYSEVRLQPGSDAAERRTGPLVGNDIGTLVKVDYSRFETPFFVRGPRHDCEYYARDELVVVHVGDSSGSICEIGESAYGRDRRISEIPIYSEVTLQPGSNAAKRRAGALVGSDVGMLVNIDYSNPEAPFVVRGPRQDVGCYARDDLVVVHVGQRKSPGLRPGNDEMRNATR